jgi:hypothetical protein
MNPLSPRTERLLELARDEEPPNADVRDRVERSLARRVALGAGVVAGSAAVTKSAVGAGVALSIAKPLAIAGLAFGVAVASWKAADLVVPPNSAPRATPPAAHTKLPARDVKPSAPSLPLEQPNSPRVEAPPAKPASTAQGRSASLPTGDSKEVIMPDMPTPPATPDELRAETDALRLAQRALRDGDATRALALLDEQDRSYRSGLLGQERAAARVMALCQAGQADQARAEAASFERRFPRSPLVPRVRSSCREP